MRIVSKVILAVLVASSVSIANEEEHSVQMECPCEVVVLERYKDGGSLGGTIRCANGSLEFSWRSGMFIPREGSETEYVRHAYIGASYWRDEAAVQLEVGSQEELDLIRALQCAVDAVLSQEEQDKIYSEAVESADSVSPGQFLARYSEEERRAIYLMGMVISLEMQRFQSSGW